MTAYFNRSYAEALDLRRGSEASECTRAFSVLPTSCDIHANATAHRLNGPAEDPGGLLRRWPFKDFSG